MFLQMALLAPLTGGLVFLLMYYFFRRLMMVIAAMSVAMLSVIWTMGLLTGIGFSLHIMSSMIPIFLMPIAILDSIHILSEFFDRYPKFNDRRATLQAVLRSVQPYHVHHPDNGCGLFLTGAHPHSTSTGLRPVHRLWGGGCLGIYDGVCSGFRDAPERGTPAAEPGNELGRR